MPLDRHRPPPVENQPKTTLGPFGYGEPRTRRETGQDKDGNKTVRHVPTKGPLKWCKRCSRKHRARDVCRLFLRTRVAKSGARVQRWAH